MSDRLDALARELLALAARNGLAIVTAESCTAGLLCQVLSDAPGAAERFHGGFVTYTKAHKANALGVSPQLLHDKGAVCAEVARAMADSALLHSSAGISAAITGVAGPEPDDDGNPVGRVHIAVARRGSATRDVERNYGALERDEIRRRAVADALRALIEAAAAQPAAAVYASSGTPIRRSGGI